MRFTVEEATGTHEAYVIPQRWAVISTGPPIGTQTMLNCLGIIIHNRVGEVGAVAHVEAQSPQDAYLRDIDKALETVVARINQAGGATGSFAVVLMGNGGNLGSQFDQDLEALLYRHVGAMFRLKKLDIMDIRNGPSRGTIGAAQPPTGLFTACVYEPLEERLWLMSGYQPSIIELDGKHHDVQKFPVQ